MGFDPGSETSFVDRLAVQRADGETRRKLDGSVKRLDVGTGQI
jgi:hypothetical protein